MNVEQSPNFNNGSLYEQRKCTVSETVTKLDVDEPVAAFLPYQQKIVKVVLGSLLSIIEKSRRIGATWALAGVAVVTAATKRGDGGMDVFYIGYNLEMAREFIDTCAEWRQALTGVLPNIKEQIFEKDKDGNENKDVKAFRIDFGSGFVVMALTSKPRSLRGRQGWVIFDEAAFHDELAELLKAANALMIWGGRVTVISTHDGEDNPFNELIQDIRGGKRKGKVVRVTFADAIQDGLYERICLVKGIAANDNEKQQWIDEIYGIYGDAAEEELNVVPAQGSGVYLTRAQIKSVMTKDNKVVRLTCPEGFEKRSDEARAGFVDAWLEDHVAEVIKVLPTNRATAIGQDFARSMDLSVLAIGQEKDDLSLDVPLIVEMRNVPFTEQQRVISYLVTQLPRWRSMKMDARGNGQALAERCQQLFGFDRVDAVMTSSKTYLEWMPLLKAAIIDQDIHLPMDADTENDLRQIKLVRGIAQVPDQRIKDSNGKRHGDTAIALMMLVAAIDTEVLPTEGFTTGQKHKVMGTLMGEAETTQSGWGSVAGAMRDVS